MAEQLVEHSSPVDDEGFDHFMSTLSGVLWVIQAIASTSVRSGEIDEQGSRDANFLTTVLNANISRLEEVMPELVLATRTQAMTMGYTEHGQDGTKLISEVKPPSEVPNEMMERWFGELVQETLAVKEKFSEVDIVMVAGQQGVGKSMVINHLENQGYKVLSMSEIVRGVVSSWGLDQRETIDKIVGGQVFKEYFGSDILVYLGVEHLVAGGAEKIVIDGPRLVGEAKAVLDMGGRLIGVVADLDYELDSKIRRGRIEARAIEDPSRANDVGKFDDREVIEGENIRNILGMVDQGLLFINQDKNVLLLDLDKVFAE